MQNCLYELAKHVNIWDAGENSTRKALPITTEGSMGFQEWRLSGSKIGSRGADSWSIERKSGTMGKTEVLLIWYNRGTVPSICRTLSSERNASKVQFHNGIKEDEVRMLNSQPQLDNRQAAPLCSLLVLVALSPGNGRRGPLVAS